MKYKFYLSSDHGGYILKHSIKDYLIKKGYEVIDLGTDNENISVSYAKYGKELAKSVLKDKESYGIGVCGTGIGISFAVNRFKGIRGARLVSIEDAKLAKEHNNANIILFGGRQTTKDQAIKMIEMFLNTKFEGGRHIERINSLDE